MAITVERDTLIVKLRRAVALPFYAIALVLCFLSDGIADLAAILANDAH
jgi:hypothetical protein